MDQNEKKQKAMQEEKEREASRDFLRSVKIIEWQISRIAATKRRLEMEMLPGGIRYDLEKVQTSPSDRQLEKIVSTIDLDKKIAKLVQARIERLDEITRIIEMLEKEETKTVMSLHYVEKMPIKEIAEIIDYTKEGVYGLKRKGLLEMYQYLPAEWKLKYKSPENLKQDEGRGHT